MGAVRGAGRKPDPVGIRLLKNDKAHQHRYKDRNEPNFSTERPVAPEWLSEQGKIHFEEFVQMIEELYPASASWSDLIAEYADNEERLRYNRDILKREGQTYESYSEKGGTSIKEHPLVKIVKDCRDFKFKILTEFGLSASSGSRVNIKPKDKPKENPFAVFDKAKKG